VAKVDYSANPRNGTPMLGRLVLWQIESGMTFERAEAGVKTQETEQTVEVRRQESTAHPMPKMSRGGKPRSEVPGRVPHQQRKLTSSSSFDHGIPRRRPSFAHSFPSCASRSPLKIRNKTRQCSGVFLFPRLQDHPTNMCTQGASFFTKTVTLTLFDPRLTLDI
jgi:hypothetical protein